MYTHLIQLLLPLYNNQKEIFPRKIFDQIQSELTERFGGATSYTRSPAVGLWEEDSGIVKRDDIILIEVMVESLDAKWWSDYRKKIESLLNQEAVIIRAFQISQL